MIRNPRFWLALFLAVVALVILARFVVAAQDGAVLDSPKLVSFHATPLYRPDRSLKSLNVVFTYEVLMLLPDGKTIEPHLKILTADFVVQKGQLVPIGNQVVEFGDLAEDMFAVADFVWFLNEPRQLSPDRMPLPERRKKVPVEKRRALREP